MPKRGVRSEAAEERERNARTTRSLNLTMGGITLLGVILASGSPSPFGLSGGWWIRLAGGVGTIVVLVTVVKLASSSGRGPLARAANGVIGAPGGEG